MEFWNQRYCEFYLGNFRIIIIIIISDSAEKIFRWQIYWYIFRGSRSTRSRRCIQTSKLISKKKSFPKWNRGGEKPRRWKRGEKIVEPRGFLAIMENRDGSGANRDRVIDCRIGFRDSFRRKIRSEKRLSRDGQVARTGGQLVASEHPIRWEPESTCKSGFNRIHPPSRRNPFNPFARWTKNKLGVGNSGWVRLTKRCWKFAAGTKLTKRGVACVCTEIGAENSVVQRSAISMEKSAFLHTSTAFLSFFFFFGFGGGGGGWKKKRKER